MSVSGNPVVDRFGGRRWISAAEALERIRVRTGCTENEALKALRVWINDGRVKARGDGTSLFFTALLQLKWPDIQSFRRQLWEIDSFDLATVLEPSGTKHGGGPKEKYDWAAVKMVLEEGCDHYGGVPRRQGPNLKWKTLADACEYVYSRMKWTKTGGPAKSTLEGQVGKLLEDIERRMTDN
jgi:hypothetical protein